MDLNKKNGSISEISKKKIILSAWSDDSLAELHKDEIYKKIIDKYEKIPTTNKEKKLKNVYSRSYIHRLIKKYEKEGIIQKNNNKYRPSMIPDPREPVAPAFFVRNNYYSKHFCINVNDLEYMHYYRHKKYVIDKYSTISEKEFNNALQNLSYDIKKALSKFYNKTKELPIVLSYMTYDNDVKINYEELTELKKSNIKNGDIINSGSTGKGKTITYSLDFIKDLKHAHLFGLGWQNENEYIIIKVPKKSSKIVFDKIKNASKEELKEILTKHNIEHKSFSKLQYYQ